MKEKILDAVYDILDGGMTPEECVERILNAIIIPVDKDNLPKDKIMAIFNDIDPVIGYLEKRDSEAYPVVLKAKYGTLLKKVTYYMEIPKIN